jgi:hypothetical protein
MKRNFLSGIGRKSAAKMFGGCILATVVILIVWTFNLYPVAVVNYHPVMAYKFNQGLDVAVKYFGVTDPTDEVNLKAAVLEEMIDEISINAKLLEYMSRNEINQKIDSEAANVLGDESIRKRLEERMISLEEAKKYLVRSMVFNQLLNEKLSSEGSNILAWLAESRQQLKVMVLMPHAHWDGSKITFD